MTGISVEGFLPSNFTDVQHESVYINGNKHLVNQSVTAGQRYSLEISIPDNQSMLEKKISVKLIFNAIHACEEVNLDIRALSACVTYVGFKDADN